MALLMSVVIKWQPLEGAVIEIFFWYHRGTDADDDGGDGPGSEDFVDILHWEVAVEAAKVVAAAVAAPMNDAADRGIRRCVMVGGVRERAEVVIAAMEISDATSRDKDWILRTVVER